jgi:DegV family protein with EDD domain
MLKIVMDSAGDMPAGWVQKYKIEIIPVNIHFGDRTFLQGIDLSNSEFYRMAEESKQIPKTSQPTPHQFKTFYERIAKTGDTILSLHVTGKLSGTLASAQIAAQELVDRFRVIPIDSGSGSAAMGLMCQEARLMEWAGASAEKIVERMKEIASTVSIFLTLDKLEFARKSGRVKALQAALASILDVKPIIKLRDGVLELGERVRTRKKALEFLVKEMKDRMGDLLVNAAVVHAEDIESARDLLALMEKNINCKQLIVTELSIGIAANLGPGTVGIVAYPVSEG